MAKFDFTDSQKLAINSRNSSILVSAAAGSGKTRVLTERLMAYVTSEDTPVDIDSFLIITFTRAAAAELKSRILTELIERSAKDPLNKKLKRQINLCYRAPIGTIHNFCTMILRENAHDLGMIPDFKIADTDKSQQIKLRCLEQILDNYYKNGDADFRILANTIGAGLNDARLQETILKLHEKMKSHPDPVNWVERQILILTQKIDDVSETKSGKFILERARMILKYYASEMEKLLEIMHSKDEYANIVAAYSNSVEETALAIRDAIRSSEIGWDKFTESFPIVFPNLKALKNSPDPKISDYIKFIREECKTACKKMHISFTEKSEQLINDMEIMSVPLVKLFKLTLEFDMLFLKEKQKNSLVDFADLEHLALEILVDKNGNPTPRAVEISRRYTEVMIDEYQDVNEVQEKIFCAVSKHENNLFMVGDVKQSIYRFRLADPTIFLKKYSKFARVEIANENENRKILLKENFRSRQSVLSAANKVFENIMSPELGEIDYNEEHSLNCGAVYYDKTKDEPALLTVINVPDATDEETPKKTEIEAKFVANRVKQLVLDKKQVQNGDSTRDIKFSDIVILLRSPGKSASVFSSALADVGIPVKDGKGIDFFGTPEVSAVISMLSIVDNPRQDIPLISVLRSVLFNFSADELASIRSNCKIGDFYNALISSENKCAKIDNFILILNDLRELSADLPTDELIIRIFIKTNALSLFGAMEFGEEKRRNLMMLYEFASKFEADGFRGLFKFVSLLRRMEEKGESPNLLSTSGENAVSIMSIHKSKGLEFPVVFLCETSRKFNKLDMKEPVLIHSELGLGPKITDIERRVEYPTLWRRAVKEKLLVELLSEEMRVLYVALTRAKERIFITCAMKKAEEFVNKMRLNSQSPMPPAVLQNAQTPATWLISSALSAENEIKLEIVDSDGAEKIEAVKNNNIPTINPEILNLITERLNFKYQYNDSVKLPSKLTVTELKGTHSENDPESEEFVGFTKKTAFELPDFTEDRALSGTERGTATHLVMQFINFEHCGTVEGIKMEIERLKNGGFLNERQANAVDPKVIFKFFMSDIGKRLLSANEILREFPFSVLCEAKDFYNTEKNDTVLLQGVLDCCIIEGNEITIIDYKTDFACEENLEELVNRYSQQVNTYAKVMERILKKKVRETVLYFLRGGISVSLYT